VTASNRILLWLFLALFLLPLQASPGDNPSVHVSVQQGSILVEASDQKGLDSLDMSCPDSDSRYHTGLPNAESDRHFKRSFALSDVFPEAAQWKHPVRVTITVRNTRGATSSTTILIQSGQTKKGQ
jgi:hypothetical protein